MPTFYCLVRSIRQRLPGRLLFPAGLALALLAPLATQAQVGIGTTTPDSKAELDISATSRGLLIPRLTSTQRHAIARPPQGLLVFQTGPDSTGFWYATGSGTAWLWLPDVASAKDNLGNHTATQALDLNGNRLVSGGTTGLRISSAGTVHTDGELEMGANLNLGLNKLVGQGGSTGIYIGSNGDVFTDGLFTPGGNINLGPNRLTGQGGSLGVKIANTGTVTLETLAGSGSRMVTTDSNGDLSATDLPTDAQQLSISSSTISLTNGGSVTVPSSADNLGNHTATQTLDLQGNTITGTGASISGVGLGVRADGGLNLGQRALGNNVLAGFGAGATLTPTTSVGRENLMVGYRAGAAAEIGSQNVFLGYEAGTNAQVGDQNAYVGYQAGFYTNFGSKNTAIGYQAGPTQTFLNALTNTTAIGYQAQVSQNNSLVLGGTGANAVSVGIGTTAPAATLHVVGSTRLTGLAGAGTRMVTADVNGDLSTQAVPVDTDTDAQQLSISGSTISLTNGGSVTVPSSADNLGNHTATQALDLQANALTGTGADVGTAVGVGIRADGGLNIGQNTTGNNLFLGYLSGAATTTATGSLFVGYRAGTANTSAINNQFIGYNSGAATTTGRGNHFNGYSSGIANTTGQFNHFEGFASGSRTVSGSNNYFSGVRSGFYNTTGSNNWGVGYQAGPTSGNLTNAGALGYNASVSQSHSLVLGGTGVDTVNVGIGTTAPAATLHVVGSARISKLAGTGTRVVTTDASGSLGTTTTASLADNLGNHTATTDLLLGTNALTGTGSDLGAAVGLGVRADGGLNLGQNTAGNNFLLGYQAGQTLAATTPAGIQNHFVGYQAGASNGVGGFNQFEGYKSGYSNTSGFSNQFSGNYSGYLNTTGAGNLFVGYLAGGLNTTGTNNWAFGRSAGPSVDGLTNAGALGYNAKVTQSNSLVLGGTDADAVQVGIGTTAPTATLHVAGSSSTVKVEGLAGGGRRLVTAAADGTLGVNVPVYAATSATALPTAAAGSVSTGSQPQDVALSGTTAYVVNYTSGTLQLFDVSTPAAPMLLGSVSTGGNPLTLAVSGTKAYVATRVGSTSARLQVFDVATPVAPALLGSVELYNNTVTLHDVAVYGTTVYVLDSNRDGVYIVDVATPAAPTLLSTSFLGNISPWKMQVSGTTGYILDNDNTTANLRTYDLSTPATPVLLGSGLATPTGSSPEDLAVSGTTAYVADATTGTLRVFSVATPAAPVLLGTVSLGTAITYSYHVAVSGTTAYVTNSGANTLQLVDVGTPASPVLLGSLSTGAYPAAVAVSGTTVAVVNRNGGTLQVFTGPAAVRTVAVDADGNLTSVATPRLSVSGTTLTLTGSNSVTLPGDDLGNHTATQDLDLSTYKLVGNGGSTGLSVTSAGNVGVGTTSPVGKLQVVLQNAGTLDQDNTSGTTATNSVSTVAYQTFKPATTGYLQQVTLSFSSSGVGTARTVSIYSGTGTGGTLLGSATVTPTAAGLTTFSLGGLALTSGSTYTIGISNQRYWEFNNGVYTRGSSTLSSNRDYLFQTYMSAGPSAYDFTVADGGVGIGTTAPAATLEVSGSTSTVRLGGLAGTGTRVVTADTDGDLSTTTTASLGDNLGTGVATTNVDLSIYKLVGNGGTAGISISSAGAVTTGTTLTTGGAITAGGKVDLGSNSLVGNGGTTGISISSAGVVATAGALTTGGQITAGGNLDLSTHKLVGNGGTAGISISNGGAVGLGITSPSAQFGNTAINTIGADGRGGNLSGTIGTLNWTLGTDGYAGSFYNSSSATGSNGLAVKTQATDASTTVLDVSTGAQATAGTSRLVVKAGGNVGIGVSSPLTALDVVGALSVESDGTTTSLTADDQTVTVGNRTYVRLTSTSGTANQRTVVLSNGLQAGQLLIIENADAANSFEVGDSGSTNANTNGSRSMGPADTITLIWNGTDWLEVNYANN